MSLPEALERAASELVPHADAVRDANGDPDRLLETLPGAAASEVLAWLLEHEPAAGEELALAWSDLDGGAGPLQSLDPSALPKPARKALRRALHRLRSRGIEVASAAPSPGVSRLPSIDESIEAGLVSSLDPRGTRMAYLVASQAGGGARIFEALLDEQRGIVEFRIYSTGRSRARRFLRELSGKAAASMFEVEPDALRALLAHAAARQPADRPAPRAFVEHRSQLRLDVAAATPAQQVVEALGAGSDDADAREARLERVAERVREHALGPWPPPLEQLARVFEPLRERASSQLIVSGAVEADRRREALAEAAGEIFDEGFREVTAARLRDTAFALWRAEREEEARDCLAAAGAFEQALPEHPVALAFAEVWFGPMLDRAAEEDRSREEDSLLVKP